MSEFLLFISEHLFLLTIPLISATVGWFTNYIALKMTFYPINYVGVKPFGWQGIIPAKAAKMAEIAADLWQNKLVNLNEEFARIEPARMVDEMGESIKELSRDIIDEVMDAKLGRVWHQMPASVKENIYQKVSAELPTIVEAMMSDVRNQFDSLLDLKKLSVLALTQNRKLLNQVFIKCGRQEFNFIEKSGFWFGLLFGLFQMVAWYFYPSWWVLPTAGLLVGYLTNTLALKLIFRPLKPIKLGPIIFQGLFIKRQKEVSEEYSKIVAAKIVTVESIFEYIIRGPGAAKMRLIIEHHLEQSINKLAGFFEKTLRIIIGDNIFIEIRNIASFKFMQDLPMNIRHVFGYAQNALNLETILREKMKALSPVEFEAFLRPVFKEDERTLILVGALLGGIAGAAQAFVYVM